MAEKVAMSKAILPSLILAATYVLVPTGVAWGHFLVLIPSRDVVDRPSEATIHFDIQFTHPMEQGPVMPMGAPRQFFVVHQGQRGDLRDRLQSRTLQGQPTFTLEYRLQTPGDYVFAFEPVPYWEAAEKKWIIHHTKVVVNFMGEEGGWERPVGLPVEIQPLTRPYGLWTGNCFRGIVLHQGRPVPFARIEVEYWNEGKQVVPPNDAFITQVIKADGEGVFCYSIPQAGWWGFAALLEGGEKRPGPDGQPADVELGALIWVQACNMAVDSARLPPSAASPVPAESDSRGANHAEPR